MKSNPQHKSLILVLLLLLAWGCTGPMKTARTENKKVPKSYSNSVDTSNTADMDWRSFYSDAHLISLIDTALRNNQELNIFMQEIEISRNEVKARKGEYLPFLDLKADAGVEKDGLFTRHGAVDRQLEIRPGEEFPEPFSDFLLGATASWELDIWKKLRNAKQAAFTRYMASVEGRNFLVTNMVAEIADSYYELMALDNLMDIIEQNIAIQSNAFEVVKQQKASAKVTQLAVNRFEAQLLNTQNLQYAIKQRIVETENRINFLTGRYPSSIQRSSGLFNSLSIDAIQAGIPAQLMMHRPDIRQAELELAAAKLDVKAARANFYPSLGIKAGIGYQAFKPEFLLNPESVMFNLAGDLVAPLLNRNAIKAEYWNANAQQMQAVFNYEQTLLNAYVDVLNQLSKIDNYSKSYDTKEKEVNLLVQSTGIANNLFNSARADYGEVLLTQREALEAKVELIEIKMQQLNAKVNVYRALGGGWK